MGRACLERFCGEHLLLVDIDDGALEAARALAPKADCAVADLGSRASIETLVGQVEAMGGLDRLVHLAGVSPMMDDAARILEVDLVGTAVLLNGLVTTAGPGSVAICIASIAAHLLPVSSETQAVLDEPMAPDLAIRLERALGSELGPGTAYALAKHGVVRLCQRSAAAWGARGARCPLCLPWAHRHAHGTARAEGQPGQAGAHRADTDRRTARRRVGRTPRADGGHRRRD